MTSCTVTWWLRRISTSRGESQHIALVVVRQFQYGYWLLALFRFR